VCLNPATWFLLLFFIFALTPVVKADTVTLQEGLKVVASQGYEMRIAMSREEAAAKSLELASARHRPQINAYADHTWLQHQPEAVLGGGTAPLGDDSFLRYGVTVKQLITDFGRTRSSIDAARAGARSQKEETGRTRNAIALDYIASYISLLQAEKALTLADLEVQRFEAHVSDTRALYSAGEITLNDVLAAEVALADARSRRITILDERNLAASRLNYLILRPLDDATAVLDFPFLLDPVPEIEDVSARSGSIRPELKILDAKINQKKALLSSSEAESYPTLFLGGGYAFEENSYRVHEGNWSAMIGINWELYTGGARTAAKKQVMDELAALITQREQLKEQINLQIMDSHRLLTGALERAIVTQKAVTQAEENLRLQKLRYTEGEASATEVTDAVTSLARAEDNHWSAKYSRLKAEAQLLYAAGDDLTAVYSMSDTMAPGEPPNTETGEKK
jgi:outer membrane protein TolC